MRASSPHKFLRFVVGRHDLPFYYSHSADLQQSFFDCFLKGNDEAGWTSGKQPRVKLILRQGDAGVDDPERELSFPHRDELDWPIPDTLYTKYYLTADQRMSTEQNATTSAFNYDALQGYVVHVLLSRRTSTDHPQGASQVYVQHSKATGDHRPHCSPPDRECVSLQR